jgi:hypothetical protein
MTESFPLDHFMLATPDLEASAVDIEQRTGVRPTPGGAHPGQGTRNKLLSLGTGCYLELIGPNESQDQIDNFGARLGRLSAPTLLMFGVRTHDINAAWSRAIALGLWACSPSGARVAGPIAMSRALPGGGLLQWQILLLGADSFDRGLPFFIQWHSAVHPSESSAAGCVLKEFWIAHPSPSELAKLYSALSVAVNVVAGSAPPSFNLIIDTPRGAVTF